MAKRGRPLAYPTPEALQAAVDSYFEECKHNVIVKQVVSKGEIVRVETPEPFSMAGLASHLGVSRQTLLAYDGNNGERADYLDIISRARLKIERSNIALSLVGCYDSRIANLNLASNFGYFTKQDVDANLGSDPNRPLRWRVEIVDPGAPGLIPAGSNTKALPEPEDTGD